MSERKTIIEIEHLNKTFGDVKAVRDLSFRVKEGELFAFLGVNGAGKSTTISMICGQLNSDSGDIWVNGQNVKSALQELYKLACAGRFFGLSSIVTGYVCVKADYV